VSDPVIQTHDLTRRYGATVAVDHVDLAVARGEIYGFLGRNGAGKTTLIRLLLGLIRPTTGTVSVFGHVLGRGPRGAPSPWARVGYLVESPGLYPDLTVLEQLRIAARYRKLPASAVDEAVALLDLTRWVNVPAKALSLGNRQRLGLALAVINRPDLMVLDEPVNGLDPAGVVDIRLLLRRMADEGVTVFMSTHIIGEVARLADRVGIIHSGRLIEELSTERLAAASEQRVACTVGDPAQSGRAAAALRAANLTIEVTGTRLTCADPDALAHPDRLATLLVAAGTPPTSLFVEHEDLEQHFLRLTEGQPQ
jgi:ABC-2 type transport system ATP-binding protein